MNDIVKAFMNGKQITRGREAVIVTHDPKLGAVAVYLHHGQERALACGEKVVIWPGSDAQSTGQINAILQESGSGWRLTHDTDGGAMLENGGFQACVRLDNPAIIKLGDEHGMSQIVYEGQGS